jgi:hypothetical protein
MSFYKDELEKCFDLRKYKNKILSVLDGDDSPLKVAVIKYLELHSEKNLSFIEKLEKLSLKRIIIKNI